MQVIPSVTSGTYSPGPIMAHLLTQRQSGEELSKHRANIPAPPLLQSLFRTVCTRPNGSLLAAGQIILPPGLTKGPPKVRQDFLRNMFLEEFKGKLVGEKRARLGTMAGKEYLAETPTGMTRFRLLGTGVQMYRV